MRTGDGELGAGGGLAAGPGGGLLAGPDQPAFQVTQFVAVLEAVMW